MRIGIISLPPSNYSLRRLRSEALARNHEVELLYATQLTLVLRNGKAEIFSLGRPVPQLDIVIPRLGAARAHYAAALTRHVAAMGIPLLNEFTAITNANDKLRTAQILTEKKLPFPATSFIFFRDETATALAKIGGAPVVVKRTRGSQGIGVIFAPTDGIAAAVGEALVGGEEAFIFQNFVATKRSTDVRAFVIGSKVVAAMRRTARAGEFRSNVHRGATVEVITLTAAQSRLAVAAVKALGLSVGGVDLIEGKTGMQILEVNASPGLEGIETASGVNIAELMIREAERTAKRAGKK